MSDWPGFFISVEGLDGAGKSTQVAALGAAVGNAGYDVVTVRPQDTQLGDLIRGYVLQHQTVPVDPWVEALLFNAGRIQLLDEVVVPALERGAVVIADRYADSTLAYQGGGRGIPVDQLRRLHEEACRGIWPDLTFFLEIPYAAAVQRQRAQQLPFDRIEGAPERFHAAVQRTFEELAQAEPGRVVRVDASRSAVAISQELCETALARLGTGRAAALQP